MNTLIEASQELPVIGEYDVLVSGGGPAGVSAAVAASRVGAKTAIVERYGYLGGQATGGLVILLVGLSDGKETIIKGICEETINNLKKMNFAQNIGHHILFDPEALKLTFDDMIESNKVIPYYHSYVSNTIASEGWISGVIIDGKSGRNVIKAKMFVDATGDADLAKYCNIPYDLENKDNLLPVSLGFRVGGLDISKIDKFIYENREQYLQLLHDLKLPVYIGGWIHTIHKGEAWFNVVHIENIDATNCDELTRAEIHARKKVFKIIETFKKNVPGFENGYLIDTAPQLGIRDSRRIKGLYRFGQEDILKQFDDAIAKAPDYTGSGRGSVEIPYGCLISKSCGNLIFAGRCISVEHKLLDMFREIPCCMATGQAAGAAAGIAALTCAPIQKVDTTLLRKELLHQGAIL